MVVEGWDEGDVRSSPVKTRTGREILSFSIILVNIITLALSII